MVKPTGTCRVSGAQPAVGQWFMRWVPCGRARAAPADRAAGMVTRWVVTGGIGVLAGLVPAVPAYAHPPGIQAATDYRTRVSEIAPAIAGVAARFVDDGSQLELRNESGGRVQVLGYQGEAYLLVGPDGVWQNLRSPLGSGLAGLGSGYLVVARRALADLALGLAGLWTVVAVGLANVAVFSHAVAPIPADGRWARLAIAGIICGGVGCTVAAVLRLRRESRAGGGQAGPSVPPAE
jgi:hypothetical protein